MANVNAPRGFSPVRYSDGRPYNGASNVYYKNTTAGIIAVGDPVIRVTASVDPLGGQEIVRATTGAAITGVVVGIQPVLSNLAQVGYLAAADTGYVLVADEPDLIFEVQEGGSSTALAASDTGTNINSITAIDANTTTGRSKYQIDNGAKAAGDTWAIVALVQRADNALGLYAKWLVKPSLHTEQNASAQNVTNI